MYSKHHLLLKDDIRPTLGFKMAGFNEMMAWGCFLKGEDIEGKVINQHSLGRSGDFLLRDTTPLVW